MTDHGVGQLETPFEPSPDRRSDSRHGFDDGLGHGLVDRPFARPGYTGAAGSTPYPEAPDFRRPAEPILVGRPIAPPPAPPRPSRVPLLVTAAVLLVAVLVVGVATAISLRPEPAPVAAPPIDPVALAGTGTRIGFSSAEGAGTLAIQQHRWVSDPGWTSVSGTHLLVELRLTGSEGSVSVDPALFQVFDSTGGLYDSQTPDPLSSPLESGVLRAGESASGWVAFDLPRGDVTLVLSNPSGQAVTALRITG